MKVSTAAGIYLIGNVFAAAVPFALLPILTRVFTPDEYGTVVLFFLLAGLAASVSGLNVHGAVPIRWFDRRSTDFPKYVGSALAVALTSTLVAMALLWCAGWLWHQQFGLQAWLWPFAGLMAGATVVASLRSGLWQSQQKPVESATFQVGGAVLNMALSLGAVLYLGWGSAGRIFGAVLATVVVAVGAVALLRSAQDLKWSCARTDVHDLLKFGVPLIPHTLAGFVLGTIDRFAVSVELGPGALGIYGAAVQLGMVINVLADAAIKAMSPWMYAQLAASSARSRLRVVGVALVAIPFWLVTAGLLWLIFRAVGPLLLGKEYQDAIQLSVWFLLTGAVWGIYANFANMFFFKARTELLALATMTSAVVAVLLAPVLVGRFGIAGAGAAALASQTVQLVLVSLLSLRLGPMPWLNPGLALRTLTRRRVQVSGRRR